MIKEIFYREAERDDIPFLVDVIIEAEKSGTDRLSYSSIFGITEKEVRSYLNQMLLEEMEGCGELSISSYLLATKNNTVIAAACAWVEGVEGIPTSVLKGNLIRYIMPKDIVVKAAKLHKLLSELHFDYKNNVIHMGAGYVVKEYRGNNLLYHLKEKQINYLQYKYPDIKEAYVDTFEASKAALRTSEKLGFEIIEVKESLTDEILRYLPSKRKYFLKKELN